MAVVFYSMYFCAGVVIVPGAAIGQILGGVVLKRWKFKVRGTLRFIVIVIMIALLSKAAFFIRCDQDKLVGWNTPYENRLVLKSEVLVSTLCRKMFVLQAINT